MLFSTFAALVLTLQVSEIETGGNLCVEICMITIRFVVVAPFQLRTRVLVSVSFLQLRKGNTFHNKENDRLLGQKSEKY